MSKITLHNHFHNTEVTIHAEVGDVLTPSQLKRVRKALCGMRDCGCGALCQQDRNRAGNGLGNDADGNIVVAW
jgi:hypothetical protein